MRPLFLRASARVNGRGAADEHDRRQACLPGGCQHVRIIPSEEAAADQQDAVDVQTPDGFRERGRGRNEPLDVTKRPGQPCAPARLASLARVPAGGPETARELTDPSEVEARLDAA